MGLVMLDHGGPAMDAYLSHVIDEATGKPRRPPDQSARCSGKRGRCGFMLARQWSTPAGAVVVVWAPRAQRSPNELRAVRSDVGRLKAPDGIQLGYAFAQQVPPGTVVTAWCPDHEHRTVNISEMRDVTRAPE